MLNAVLVMLVVGGLMGLVLGVASIVFHVEIDNRIDQVISMLPGINCGGCGYAGCKGMAEALVSQDTNTVSLCKPSKMDAKIKIAEYLNSTPGPDGKVLNVKP
ncbi:electron transporter RnfB [Erysipelotrichaceae bacterium OH741_COT-311]|nr:electron transporter RnfB [Erysipelotrichaceae bacterium OH741_COT-311]